MGILPLAHIIVKFELDGKTYDVDGFNVSFEQPSDYKGQPQHEIEGGKLFLRLTQVSDTNLYLWAKTSTMLKSGKVFFRTDMGMTVLEISFTDAYCMSLKQTISEQNGTTTSLMISPMEIVMNGIKHSNEWKL